MEKRRIVRMLMGLVGVLAVALVAVELPARAAPRALTPPPAPGAEWLGGGDRARAADDGPLEVGGGLVAEPEGLIQPPPPPPPPEDGGDDGGDDSGDTVTVVERHTIWRILFPYETLGSSIKAALGEIVMEAARDIGGEAVQGITNIARAVLGDGDFAKGIRDVRQDVWQVGIVIAGLLLPFSFMASVVVALKDGTSSVSGYASAREAILNWVIAAGAAVSSYFLLDKAIALSGAATSAIFEALLGGLVDSFDLGAFFAGGLVEGLAYVGTPGIFQLFLMVFGMLLAIALLLSIALAFLAKEVILVLAVGVAPVMLVMGGVGPLRWINGLWMKVTTIALLLGPANAFLIGAGAMLALNARQSGLDLTGFGGRILGYLVTVGVISVLIGLNSMIGKMVYGAAIEIAEKAANGIMVAVGAVAGLGAAGLLGGAGVGAAAAGGTAAGSTASAAGSIGSMAQASSAAKVAGALGQAGAAMGLPGGRGFAAGMNAGGSLAAHRQIKQGIADAAEAGSGRLADTPWDKSAFSNPEALAAAAGGVRGELEAMGDKGTLAKMHMPSDAAMQRVSGAEGVAGRLMEVGQKHGVDTLAGLRQMGMEGRDAQAALIEYNRDVLKNLAFGGGWPHRAVPFRQLPNEMTMRDLYTTGRILRVSDPGYAGVPSVEFLDRLAQTVQQRRVQLDEDPHRTIEAAGRASDLEKWMQDSYARLPDKDAASGLKAALGA